MNLESSKESTTSKDETVMNHLIHINNIKNKSLKFSERKGYLFKYLERLAEMNPDQNSQWAYQYIIGSFTKRQQDQI